MIQAIPQAGRPALVPLTSIVTLPQIRTRNGFDKESLQSLAESIKEHGVIEPVVLAQLDDAPDSYQLIAGERRVLAAELAGLSEVPATVRTGTIADLAAVQAVENLQREDLAVLDVAEGLKAMLPLYKTPKALAKALGKSPSWVSKRMRLAKLTPAVMEAASNGLNDVETITTLDTLARIKSDKAQSLLKRCLKEAEKNNLTREMARTCLANAKKPEASPALPSDEGAEDADEGETGGNGDLFSTTPLNLTADEVEWMLTTFAPMLTDEIGGRIKAKLEALC